MSLPTLKVTNNLINADVQVTSLSSLDPNGFVFSSGDNFYRVIKPEVAEQYRSILNNLTVNSLIDKGKIVRSKISNDFNVANNCLLLKHDKIYPQTYAGEWSPLMLKDAALLTLEIALELLNEDLYMQDASTTNILFNNSNPVLVDFTSIVNERDAWLWRANDQFNSNFYFPLLLAEDGNDYLVRMALKDSPLGVGFDFLYRFLSLKGKIKHQSIFFTKVLSLMLQNEKIAETISRKHLGQHTKISKQLRIGFFERLYKKIESIKVAGLSGVNWKDYYNNIDKSHQRNLKYEAVGSYLSLKKPETVLDLGCNTGEFSLLAESSGAKVVSVDSSSACIDSLYTMSKSKNLRITPIVSDIAFSTSSHGFMGCEYLGLDKRVKCEMVLFLAVMHHIHITSKQSFARIASMLSNYSAKYLIFEFVSADDENIALISRNKHHYYTFQEVFDEINKHFKRIEVVDSDRKTRKLMLCEK